MGERKGSLSMSHVGRMALEGLLSFTLIFLKLEHMDQTRLAWCPRSNRIDVAKGLGIGDNQLVK